MIKRRIMAIAAALIGMAAFVVGPATPAMAWSYCNDNPASQPLTVRLHEYQGYCGFERNFIVPSNGSCMGFDDPEIHLTYNDWADAIENHYGEAVRAYQHADCSGAIVTIPAFSSHPNLYATPLGVNRLSALRRCIPASRC